MNNFKIKVHLSSFQESVSNTITASEVNLSCFCINECMRAQDKMVRIILQNPKSQQNK